MAEFISREALKNKKVYCEERHEYVVPVSEIDWQPKADVVEVVHGKWIKAGLGITERIVCSHCHSHKGSYLKPPFCNQCGAKMDGDNNA